MTGWRSPPAYRAPMPSTRSPILPRIAGHLGAARAGLCRAQGFTRRSRTTPIGRRRRWQTRTRDQVLARSARRIGDWRAMSATVEPIDAGTFDYIVTGAGSAGAPLPPGSARAAATGSSCWRPAAGTVIGGSTCRSATAGYSPTPGQLDVRERARAELEGRTMYQPRGKSWAAPVRSTAWSICAATRPIMICGASAAARAGIGTGVLPYFQEVRGPGTRRPMPPTQRRAAQGQRPGDPLGAGRPFHQCGDRSRPPGQQRFQRR